MTAKAKIMAFVGTMVMGAGTHVVTTQMDIFQKKHGLSSDPQKLGVQLAEKFIQSSNTNSIVTASIKKINSPSKTKTNVARSISSEAEVQKIKKNDLSPMESKLCDFRFSYINKDQEKIKLNYNKIQDQYFKKKKLTEEEAKIFIGKLENFLASGKYEDKKIDCN